MLYNRGFNISVIIKTVKLPLKSARCEETPFEPNSKKKELSPESNIITSLFCIHKLTNDLIDRGEKEAMLPTLQCRFLKLLCTDVELARTKPVLTP